MSSVQNDNSISAQLSSKLWYEAKHNLNEEEREDIRDFDDEKGDHHRIVNDVLNTAKEKQKDSEDKEWKFKRGDGSVVILRDVFSKIVDSVTKFQGAVDFLVSMDTSGHVALPWAGVKYLLSIAVKDSQKWASVLAGMEFVTRELSYYGIFEVIYLRRKFAATKQLSDALVQAYTKILQFLCGARRFYKQNSLKRFLGTTFSLDDDLASIITGIKSDRDDIERLKRLVDGEHNTEMRDGILTLSQDQKANQARLITLLNDLAPPMEIMAMSLTEVKDELREIKSEMKSKNKADELTKILAHLQPGKMINYETKVGDLTPKTATWILRIPSFKEWLEGKTPLLFGSGGPGTGKSHLSTKVIDYLRKKSQETSGRQNRVAYYYFNDSDKSTRSVLIALRAIVCQIAKEDELYRTHATEICDRSQNLAMTCGTVWNDFLVTGYGNSDSQLFLIFDGIDESEQEELKDFLHLVSRSVLQGTKIQILLVGRPEMNPIITDRFDKSMFKVIEVSSKVNIDDVRKFSQARYDELIKVSKTHKGLRRTVIDTITEKAGGMFLWVDLIYKEELRDILSPVKLKEALGKLPEGGLTNLYDHIFFRIERDIGRAKHLALQNLFSWAGYFKEPLSLFNLNEILQISGNDNFDVESIVAETCASLFVLVKTGQTLLDESTQSDMETQDREDHPRNEAGKSEGQENSKVEQVEENEDDEDDEDEIFNDDEKDDDEKEIAEMAEEHEKHLNQQRETFVHLRHASLGDYLKREDLKPTAILLGVKQGRTHVVTTMLQIVCKGAAAPQELWRFLMENFLDQLDSLDESIVSEADTKLIIGYLHEIFTSEALGRQIAMAYDVFSFPDAFFFGFNASQPNENILVIQKWLRKAQEAGLTGLNPDISNWVEQTLENRLKLLIPLVQTCVRELLTCEGDGGELSGRLRFIMECIVSTDLVPLVPQDKEYFSYDSGLSDYIRDDDLFTFIVGLSKQQLTMEMQLVVAKCATFFHDEGIKEYQKAIKMAQDEGSSDALKKCYLQQITEFVDVRDCIIYGPALDAIENYLKPDDSNAKVFACLGVVRLENEDYKGAIESFQKSLKLNNKDCQVGLALLRSLSKIKDYEGIMSVIEYHQVPIVGSWLSDGFIIPNQEMHEDIVVAARIFNKLDMGIKCYEYAYQNTQLSEEELKKAKDADSMKTAQQTLKSRTSRVAWSSMIRVYLGWLYLETLGQPDEAFELWKMGFFRCSEFLNLSNVTTSAGFTMDTIPKLFALFSQLIYEKALDPDPVVVRQMISYLEHLSRRQNVFYELNKRFFRYRTRNMDLLLVKLYLKYGRNDEGRKMLNELFQSTMDIMRGGRALHTFPGYGALAALLYLNGQLERAKVASSLRRRDLQKPEPSEGDPINYRWPLKCAGRCTSGTPLKRIPWGATLYTYTTCVDISFCENCYDTLQNKTGEKKVFVCSATHNFIKTPLDGLE